MDFRKKVAPQKVQRPSVRELVAKHGDHWWAYAGEHARNVSEGRHALSDEMVMDHCERGIRSRISVLDIHGTDRDAYERIEVNHVFPPIPTSAFDYSAVREGYDGAEDSNCPIGYGPTPYVAIADLIEQEWERA